ncbi:RagB/SusD family nutrient uptake outer membrane protein [Chitinophaga sp. Cy-1792]|uniref:RagB/SusD family nutrient uptake outer membrane protein n=1 Tax=Chitinophaga sp. Cy-1792 TaxID=2608339 RepID=UPI00141E687F|nr:RagB/SusD family nutrient uptake outer membrane protein [Chitinophaga sp. Cy-1792]NIG54126.1 RagB/SusD family nutrient uptake outer membrane protein [Chitinophaga sp. Cy-1792]
MKRIYTLMAALSVVAAGISLNSCKRDFLEMPKGGTVTVDTIFHTMNQAQYAIAEMYQLCIKSGFPANDPGNSRPEAVTDQLYILHPGYDWACGTINAGPYNVGNMSTTNTVDPSFGNHYKGIRQANLVYRNIAMVTDASDDWKKDIRAQAVFCRAMQHYELFRLYGGIPIVGQVLSADNMYVHRSSLKSTVDSIVKWCDEAAAVLPATRASVDFGKVTSVAALALKARVLLYAASPIYNTPASMTGVISQARFNDARDSVLCYPSYDKERWNLAAKANKAVIDAATAAGCSLMYGPASNPVSTGNTYDTYGNYQLMYSKYANQELILVNTFNQANASNGGFEWDQYMSSKLLLQSWGVKNNVPVEFMEKYETRDGGKFAFPETGTDLTTFIKNANLDPRFYQTIAYDGMNYNSGKSGILNYYLASTDGSITAGSLSSSDSGPDGYAFETYKFVEHLATGQGNDNKHFAWIIFRLGEFYLNYAEALNEYQGVNGESDFYLNEIRKRAGILDKHPASQDEFRTAIHNERAVELAYEGQRYSDLNRWMEAHVAGNLLVHGIATQAVPTGGGKFNRAWKKVTFQQRYFPTKYYYVPFPNAEVSKNYLGDGKSWNGQNPGW